MKSKVIKVLFLSLLFSAKIAPASEMEEVEATPLIKAILQNKPLEYIKSLVKNNADVNEKDKKDYSALMYASKNKRIDIINFLLEENADANNISNDGHTVLCFSDQEITKFIKKNSIEEVHTYCNKTPYYSELSDNAPLKRRKKK